MKKAVMYGAGNIGRGFIGQLLSQSGYEVIFLDINEAMIDALNKDHSYTITTVSNEQAKQIKVENVRAINTALEEQKAIAQINELPLDKEKLLNRIAEFVDKYGKANEWKGE